MIWVQPTAVMAAPVKDSRDAAAHRRGKSSAPPSRLLRANSRTPRRVSSQPVAGQHVADRKREEAEANRKHNGVHHGMRLAARAFGPPNARAWSTTSVCREPSRSELARAAIRCHQRHMFSMRSWRRRYKNSIYIAPVPEADTGKQSNSCDFGWR